MAATAARTAATTDTRNRWLNAAGQQLTRGEWRKTLKAYRQRRESNGYSVWDEALETRALDRLINGDVSHTRFGTRVALRPDLGDNRTRAKAYWPLNDWGCRCFYAKQNYGVCSHWLAAKVFRLVNNSRDRLNDVGATES